MLRSLLLVCLLLLLLVASDVSAQQTLQCNDYDIPPGDIYQSFSVDVGNVYTAISGDMGLTVAYEDGEVFSEFLTAGISYTVTKPAVELVAEFDLSVTTVFRVCSPLVSVSTPTAVYLLTPLPTPVTAEYITVEHYYSLALEEQRQQGLYLRFGVVVLVLLISFSLFRLSTR